MATPGSAIFHYSYALALPHTAPCVKNPAAAQESNLCPWA